MRYGRLVVIWCALLCVVCGPAARGLAATSPEIRAAARFLDQATWGAAPSDVTHLQTIGRDAWFSEQFGAPSSAVADNTGSIFSVGENTLYNAVYGPDQLRQRLAFALSEIFVVSRQKVVTGGVPPYLRLLRDTAFTNYRDILGAVTLSPTMAVYLDLGGSSKANAPGSTVPNENYARELLQLFSIGTIALNPNGTPKLDAHGQPIAAYTDTDVSELARALTGWVYPSSWPGSWAGQMIPSTSHHDYGSKVILGKKIKPHRTVQEDLNDALDIIFASPNVGPFVALRLIQHFVASNPSPAYVGRVAAIFANNASGARGDMKAVVKAVLMDPEARMGDVVTGEPASGGHLREPALYATALLRALGGTVSPDFGLAQLSAFIQYMGQLLYFPFSVIGHYSPFDRLPDGSLAGPEFRLLSASNAMMRANFVISLFSAARYPSWGFGVDFSQFSKLASNPVALVSAMDDALTRGDLTDPMRKVIVDAVAGTSDLNRRVYLAFFLVATSGVCQVVR